MEKDKLNIELKHEEKPVKTLIVDVNDYLDSINVDEFQQRLTEIGKEKVKWILFNFKNTPYVSTSGWMAIHQFMISPAAKKKKVGFLYAHSDIKTVAELLGIHEDYPFFTSLKDFQDRYK